MQSLEILAFRKAKTPVFYRNFPVIMQRKYMPSVIILRAPPALGKLEKRPFGRCFLMPQLCQGSRGAI